jgi:Ca2+-binding RTX toxin-like protein
MAKFEFNTEFDYNTFDFTDFHEDDLYGTDEGFDMDDIIYDDDFLPIDELGDLEDDFLDDFGFKTPSHTISSMAIDVMIKMIVMISQDEPGDEEAFAELINEFRTLLFGDSDFFDLSEEDDFADGFGGDDDMNGGGGNDDLNGGDGDDDVMGGAGNDDVAGDQGDDSISGDAGNDTVDGGAGNDVVDGGDGKDTLVGGAGRDFFVFDSNFKKSANVDKIKDFKVADDTIRLDNAVFKSLGLDGDLSSKAFVKNKTGKAADKFDRIIYETDTGKLFYDADGTGKGAAYHIATLSKNLAMTHADFSII